MENQKRKALQKKDYGEAAKLCNVIGETLSSYGKEISLCTVVIVFHLKIVSIKH